MLWSTAATAFKIALRGLTPVGLLFWASIFSFLALLTVVLIKGKFSELIFSTRRQYVSSMLLGLLNPLAYYIFLFFAYDNLPAREALSLNYTWAIMLGLLSVPLLKQSLSLGAVAGLIMGFAGVLVIVSDGDLSFSLVDSPGGIAAALLSAVIWALYWIFNMKDKRDGIIKLCMNFFFGVCGIGIFTAASGISVAAQPEYIAAGAYIGFFEMGFTFVFWLSALKYAKSAASIGTMVYLSPLLSLFFINTILGEEIPASTIVGLLFILGGIVVSSRKKVKPH